MAVGIALAVIGIAEAGYGIYQQEDSKNKLRDMGSRPKFQVTPEQLSSQQRAEKMAQFGFQPQERAALDQRMARSQNTAYRSAMDTGGGQLASAIRAAMSYTNFQAQNQIALEDSRMRRDNVRYADMMGERVSRQRNQMVESDQHAYDQEAAAYGAEGKAGTQNVFSGLHTAVGAFDMAGANQPPGGGGNANSPIWDPAPTPMAGGRFSAGQVTGTQSSYVPNRLTSPYATNNPQADSGYNPNLGDFASSYYRRRSSNPPYEPNY